MVKGRSGMGSHKHATSGHSTRSPRYKFQRLLDDKKEREQTQRKTKPQFAESLKDLFGKGK